MFGALVLAIWTVGTKKPRKLESRSPYPEFLAYWEMKMLEACCQPNRGPVSMKMEEVLMGTKQ